MKLTSILAAEPEAQITGNAQIEIVSLRFDSRKVERGDLFFAWKGENADGHRFIAQACDRGAAAVVLDDPQYVSPVGATYVLVPDARRALATMAAAYFGHPHKALRMIGVTGTNGKTTTAFVAKHLLDANADRVGLVGTVRYEIGKRVLPARRTTPEGLELHEILQAMRQAKCASVVMEVSSHALDQGRVAPIEFQVGVFTNLTQDHLDYHGGMEPYFEAKKKLFLNLDREAEPGVAVLNADDPYSARIDEALSFRVRRIRYSAQGKAGADLAAADLQFTTTGTRGSLRWESAVRNFHMPLVGPFNVANALAACGAALASGVAIEAVVDRLRSTPSVPGRLEKFHTTDGVLVVVDYAHTPDAVAKALQALRPLTRRRLICVVGCGGNRDAAKRPLMAKAAVEMADQAIFTSDNPRNEDPEQILDHMVAGVDGAANFTRVQDRREAIAEALAMAAAGDVICVAGKGHETYQEIKGAHLPFDDRSVIQDFLTRRSAA
jgi:UDP-N-acetylmuramoyl-L-alanyl-D-glutamate--2,6-diaminopimelate ligase